MGKRLRFVRFMAVEGGRRLLGEPRAQLDAALREAKVIGEDDSVSFFYHFFYG